VTTPTTLAPNPTARRIGGWAMILGPVLLLASTVAFITDGEGINHGHLGGTIGVWSCLALSLAFIAILRATEPVAPRAAPILTAIAVIGFAAGVGFNIDAIVAADFGREAVDAATEETPYVLLAFIPWGWFAPLTFVATGVLLWRTGGGVPRRSAGLLIAAGVLFLASRPARVEPLAVISDCALILALVPMGWSALTGAGTSDRRPVPAT